MVEKKTEKNASSLNSSKKSFRLKGRHVLGFFVLFFGALIAIDSLLIYLAVSTSTGLQESKPYEAGLNYDEEIKLSQEIKERAWQVSFKVDELDYPTQEAEVSLEKGKKVSVSLLLKDKQGQFLQGLENQVNFRRPANAFLDQKLVLEEKTPGLYQGIVTLSGAGYWEVRLVSSKQGSNLYKSYEHLCLFTKSKDCSISAQEGRAAFYKEREQ